MVWWAGGGVKLGKRLWVTAVWRRGADTGSGKEVRASD